MNYDELIKSLRVCADMTTDQCDGCCKVNTEDEMRFECESNLKREAADAIEKLSKDLMDLRMVMCCCPAPKDADT